MSIQSLLSKVATQGPDQSTATSGGDYSPPAAGTTGMRLVGYYELGKHEGEYQGQKKINNEVQLVFELIGPKHPPREVDGEKIPTRMSMTMNLSTSERSGFYKMFSALRTDERHFAQLLGKPFIGTVVHVEKTIGGAKKTFANIEKGSIKKPVVQSMDSEGNLVDVPFNVPPAISELRAFVWDFADAEMWDSIFIPGEYPERKDDKGNVTAPAKSKNVIQQKIMSALNFKGLPCYDYAIGKMSKEDAAALDGAMDSLSEPDPAPASEPAPAAPAASDPLAGV